jgi:hypothetical protein
MPGLGVAVRCGVRFGAEVCGMSDWREGDVFLWRYRDDRGDQTLKYWCRARKAIVRGGVLMDIYWAYIEGHKVNFHGEGGVWTRGQAENRLVLEYRGNLDEFEAIADYNEAMYDNADILDLRHANSSQKQVYLRKGARRSQAAMLAEVTYKIEKAESQIRHANWQIERLSKEKAKIEAGELEGVWL